MEKSGGVTKVDHEYVRNGSINVFVAVEPKKGAYLTKATKQRCAEDFAEFLKDISDTYPGVAKIDLMKNKIKTQKLGLHTKKNETKIEWRFTKSKARKSFSCSVLPDSTSGRT